MLIKKDDKQTKKGKKTVTGQGRGVPSTVSTVDKLSPVLL